MMSKMPLVNLRNLLAFKAVNKSIKRDLSKNHYDIIIAGGGMVGTTLACTLGNKKPLQDKKILLLESSKEFKWECTEKYSNRVVAITPTTQKLLESIGAWDIIERTRYGSVKKMQVWDALSDAMITFENENLNEHIAYIVENDLLLSAVTKLVKKMENVDIVNNAKIKDYVLPQQMQNNVEVMMEDENTSYTCDLLLGADGANSKVRAKMGIQYLSWNYNQMGVVATLNLSEADENVVAWQRFLPNRNGPLALLPLNNKQSSLVWTVQTDFAKNLLKLDEHEFVDELNNALWKNYEKNDIVSSVAKNLNSLLENLNLTSNAVRQLPPSIKSIEPNSRAAFPLGFGHATDYIAKGVALVGDAAHRVHPLAGQGVNLGFGDVACIADLLTEAVYSGRNMGSLMHLQEYEKLRQRYNFPTMVAIDGIQKLYGTDLTPVVLLRTMGLQITHAMNPIKKMIMGHASGWNIGKLF